MNELESIGDDRWKSVLIGVEGFSVLGSRFAVQMLDSGFSILDVKK
jgi:hypothetical protein